MRNFFALVLLLIINSSVLAVDQTNQPLLEQVKKIDQIDKNLVFSEDCNQHLECFLDDSIAWCNSVDTQLELADFEDTIPIPDKSIKNIPLAINSHLKCGIAKEALQLWQEAEREYNWILERDPKNSFVLFKLGNVIASQGDWRRAEVLFGEASLARSDFVMAMSSKALAAYQLGELDRAESELRNIIYKYPMIADARAALTALLWHKSSFGEARSHWAAAVGLDSRYMEQDWLLNKRRWPPGPINDLLGFLVLESS